MNFYLKIKNQIWVTFSPLIRSLQNPSYLAQEGVAAVPSDSEDIMEQHVKDTLTAGACINNPSVVEYYVS